MTGARPVPEAYDTRQFWFKFMPAVAGRGFDGDVLLVQVDQTRTPVTVEAVDAKVVLRDLAVGPARRPPCRGARCRCQWTTRRATTAPRVVGPVDPVAFEPFAAARYD